MAMLRKTLEEKRVWNKGFLNLPNWIAQYRVCQETEGRSIRERKIKFYENGMRCEACYFNGFISIFARVSFR